MRETEAVIPKSGRRFSDQIMRKTEAVIPKSGHRFSDQIMRKTEAVIPKSGHWFSDKIMSRQKKAAELKASDRGIQERGGGVGSDRWNT